MDTLSSQASPILSRGGEERESKENREGELDLICSFCDRDQEGFDPFSLKARGLVTDDLEDKLCRWMLLTKGRVENPPSSSLRSPGNSTDSAKEIRDVRLEEAPEARLGGLLP